MFRRNRARLSRRFFAVLATVIFATLGAECRAQTALTVGPSDREAAAERTIMAALQRPVTLQYVDRPLHSVVYDLHRSLGVPIMLDIKALNEASISRDTEITFSTAATSAGAALDAMLSTKDLAWILENEMLFVTTMDKAKSTVKTRVYPVADLVFVETADAYEADFDSLIEVITSIVAPQTWDSAGGPGSIAPFVPSGALVISQTRQVHGQIESLLAQLRRIRNVQGLPVALRVMESTYRPPDADSESSSGSMDSTQGSRQPSRASGGGAFSTGDKISSAMPSAAGPRPANPMQWRVPHVYRE
jgi:hypothetical protein